MEGRIPREIGLLTDLESIIVKNNPGLEGPIPSEIGELNKLRRFGLYNNNIDGTIPYSLYTLDQIFYLNLEGNQMSGTIHSDIDKMTLLNKIILDRNHVVLTVLECGRSLFEHFFLLDSFLSEPMIFDDGVSLKERGVYSVGSYTYELRFRRDRIIPSKQSNRGAGSVTIKIV